MSTSETHFRHLQGRFLDALPLQPAARATALQSVVADAEGWYFATREAYLSSLHWGGAAYEPRSCRLAAYREAVALLRDIRAAMDAAMTEEQERPSGTQLAMDYPAPAASSATAVASDADLFMQDAPFGASAWDVAREEVAQEDRERREWSQEEEPSSEMGIEVAS